MSAWSVEPSVGIPVTLAAVVYLRGWLRLREHVAPRLQSRHAVFFVAGLLTIVLALARPLELLAERWLSAHMVQHMLLMVVVAPLLWMGAPVAPLLVGLPRPIRRVVLAITNAATDRALTRGLLHPTFGWAAFAISFWVWHTPALYNLTLESHLWHHVEHACFLGSALLFWRPVILAWPARAIWPRWTMIPYLGLAMFQSLPLAAILTFSDRVIYRGYSLDDQALAGVIMWIPGSVPLLIPLLRLSVELSAGRVATERSRA
jgi:cytochrome c oxidase assembly factor CtaG